MSKNVWISLLIRLMFGMIFFVFGLEKLIALTKTIEATGRTFDDTWMPRAIIGAFLYILPFIEITLGLSFLVGYKYRMMLVITGILLAILTFGLAVRGDYEMVSRNLVYFFILLIGLWHSDENRYCLGAPSIKD